MYINIIIIIIYYYYYYIIIIARSILLGEARSMGRRLSQHFAVVFLSRASFVNSAPDTYPGLDIAYLSRTGYILDILGMRTRIFCLAPASQCVNSPTEAARARALLTAREATNLRARRKLDFLRMAEVSVTN